MAWDRYVMRDDCAACRALADCEAHEKDWRQLYFAAVARKPVARVPVRIARNTMSGPRTKAVLQNVEGDQMMFVYWWDGARYDRTYSVEVYEEE
jgi:hypothetical protein